MGKQGGEHLVPRVLFYVFGASGTSYSLRAPCIRFWRSPSNTFSENSAMCLNTRTECDCHEENARAAYIFWDFVVGMGFHGNVSKTHVYVFHVSRTLRFAPRYCAMAIDTWKAPRTHCLLFLFGCKSADDAWNALSSDSRRGQKIQGWPGIGQPPTWNTFSHFVLIWYGYRTFEGGLIQEHLLKAKNPDPQDLSPRVLATISSRILAMATLAPRAPSHPNAPFAVLGWSMNPL